MLGDVKDSTRSNISAGRGTERPGSPFSRLHLDGTIPWPASQRVGLTGGLRSWVVVEKFDGSHSGY